MKLLALDQSSVKTGWCNLSEDTYNGVIWESGVIDLSKEKDTDKRFKLMCENIFKLIDRVKPKHITIEETALQSNPKTLRLLAQLQGAIICHCINKGITYSVIEPSRWRRILGFKQGAGVKRVELKKQAIDYICGEYGLSVSEDEAEAICIGLSQCK